VGPLHKIYGIMRKEDYLNILKPRLHNFLDKSSYSEEDGDPKHTEKIV
ncbi:hypothetical protein KR032_011706, partial [Drosophila birchii]